MSNLITWHRRSMGVESYTWHVLENDMKRAWRAAAEGTGLCHHVDTVSGVTVVVPPVVRLFAGPPPGLLVQLLPGQLPRDVEDVALRLAPALGARMVRVTPTPGSDMWVRVELLAEDPLAAAISPAPAVASALDPILLGIAEDGAPVLLELADAAHIIVQGTTGGGKSVGCYSLLGQLAAAPDVRITGVDPTGLLLSPWAGRWADVPGPALGTSDPFAYVLAAEQVVKEMDRRIGGMPVGRDAVELGEQMPVLLFVCEEYPGILRILDTADKRLAAAFRAAVGRLLAEGRKAGVRVLLVTQRADAAIIGAYERGQASHRISYRVDTIDAARMLHQDISPDAAAEHASAAAGIALVTAPGQRLRRMRSPYRSYADYCSLLLGVSATESAPVGEMILPESA